MLHTIRSSIAARMATPPLKPLVAIVGATGTGKSDLAIEIARKFNGEIINGDAMQLYESLPIITNKVTQEEMKGVRHHLLGCIGLEEEAWTVGRFVTRALGVIDEIRSRGKLPVLVGGTHYYTQSLLFKDVLSEEPLLENGQKRLHSFPILDEPTEVILAKLKEVDPVMASRWHPNERRKIQRSLELYLKTGKPASQIYSEQRLKREISPPITANGDVLEEHNGPHLRFPTLLFWVHAHKDTLYQRLDSRIDKMLEKGLLTEVETLISFRSSYETYSGKTVDQSRGIWVSIGYKEFLDYYDALIRESTPENELAKLKSAAIEKTQAGTRQYAKRQVRWIQIKLLNALLSANRGGNIFLLDGTDLSKWSPEVLQPANDITYRFLSGEQLPDPNKLSEAACDLLTPKRDYDLAHRPDLWQQKVCETCGTVFVTENDWNLHLKSRAHRRAVGAKKKQENLRSLTTKKEQVVHEDLANVLEGYLESFPDQEAR